MLAAMGWEQLCSGDVILSADGSFTYTVSKNNYLRSSVVPEVAEGSNSQQAPPASPPAEPGQEVADALDRVQQAVTDVQEGELRESLEGAIEAIDAAAASPDAEGTEHLHAVADALEGALNELEHGRVADLVQVIDQAQSIIQS